MLKLPVQEKVDVIGGEDEFFFNHIVKPETAYKSVCAQTQNALKEFL